MRSLSLEHVKLIIDAVNENFTYFSPGALEKDFHLTEVLRVLMHVESEDFKLTFCGGTSLVKAYGCLNRMSEDIDIKISEQEVTNRSATRKKLNIFKTKISKAFIDADFRIDSIEAKNDNKFISFNLEYMPVFPNEVSLRAVIKVEFIYAQVSLPTELLPIKSILLREIGMAEPEILFTCTALEQTQAEKVLSFLRRYQNALTSGHVDGTQVRHIHDVHILAGQNLDLTAVKEAFRLAILEDIIKFRHQELEFASDPKAILKTALTLTHSDLTLEMAYETFVSELVAGQAPEFEIAFSTFVSVALSLIDSLG